MKSIVALLGLSIHNKSALSKVQLQLIADEPQLQISKMISAKKLVSQKYRYCKRIPNELQLQIAAINLYV